MRAVKAIFAVLLVTMLVLSSVYSAIPAASQAAEADADRERLRIQDTAASEDREQNRTQERDRLMDMNQTQVGITSDAGAGLQIMYQEKNYQEADDEDAVFEIMPQDRKRAQDMEQLSFMVQLRETQMNRMLQNGSIEEQYVNRNQNRVVIAAYGLQAMENMIPKAGAEISSLAAALNQSVGNTVMLESRIRQRSRLRTLLFGGDRQSALQLRQQLHANSMFISRIGNLSSQCENCTAEVKDTIQNRIREMQQEQSRLYEIADAEMAKRALFRWQVE